MSHAPRRGSAHAEGAAGEGALGLGQGLVATDDEHPHKDAEAVDVRGLAQHMARAGLGRGVLVAEGVVGEVEAPALQQRREARVRDLGDRAAVLERVVHAAVYLGIVLHGRVCLSDAAQKCSKCRREPGAQRGGGRTEKWMFSGRKSP